MKRILLLVFLCSVSLWADAQALLGTTGLLHAPTADMQRDKTLILNLERTLFIRHQNGCLTKNCY